MAFDNFFYKNNNLSHTIQSYRYDICSFCFAWNRECYEILGEKEDFKRYNGFDDISSIAALMYTIHDRKYTLTANKNQKYGQ